MLASRVHLAALCAGFVLCLTACGGSAGGGATSAGAQPDAAGPAAKLPDLSHSYALWVDGGSESGTAECQSFTSAALAALQRRCAPVPVVLVDAGTDPHAGLGQIHVDMNWSVATFQDATQGPAAGRAPGLTVPRQLDAQITITTTGRTTNIDGISAFFNRAWVTPQMTDRQKIADAGAENRKSLLDVTLKGIADGPVLVGGGALLASSPATAAAGAPTATWIYTLACTTTNGDATQAVHDYRSYGEGIVNALRDRAPGVALVPSGDAAAGASATVSITMAVSEVTYVRDQDVTAPIRMGSLPVAMTVTVGVTPAAGTPRTTWQRMKTWKVEVPPPDRTGANLDKQVAPMAKQLTAQVVQEIGWEPALAPAP